MKYILEIKFCPHLREGNQIHSGLNLQWSLQKWSALLIKLLGFLPVTEGGLAAGQDAISSQVFLGLVLSFPGLGPSSSSLVLTFLFQKMSYFISFSLLSSLLLCPPPRPSPILSLSLSSIFSFSHFSWLVSM